MTAVRLSALGQCAIETEVTRVGPESKLAFALGLYFILERGKRISRDAVVDLFWPEAGQDSEARHRLRQGLLRLKQVGIPVRADNGSLLMERASAVTDFDSLLEVNGNAESALADRESLEFLPGYLPRYSGSLAAWLDLHRARVQTAIERAYIHALKSARLRGDWTAVESLSIDCLRVAPFNEEATMARAEATVMRGSKVQALEILDAYMESLGTRSLSIGLPAKMLRSRIADRVHQSKYAALSERHFVGREKEVEELTRLLDDARASRGGARLLWGDPGIGKTRLLSEMEGIAHLKGIRVAAVRCQPTDLERPLSIFTDVVPVLRALPGALGVSAHSWTLLQRLSEHTETKETLLQPGDAAETSAATRRALFDLFEAVADETTLLFAVEDVHWADKLSWAVVETLAELSTRRRIVVLLTSRLHSRPQKSEGPSEVASALRVRQLWPLTPSDAEALVGKLAKEHSQEMPPEMLQWCINVAEGNPYYLRELLTRWLETHEPFGVPQTLSALIERRLGKLSPDAMRVLQVCVTFGTACTLERLDRVEALRGTALFDGLEELAAAGMIVCDENRVRPKHELLAQTAHTRWTEPTMRLTHHRVAAVLQAELKQEPVPALLWECAHHWEQAGEVGRALKLLTERGYHLIRTGLSDEAATLFRKALQLRITQFQQELPLRHGLIEAFRSGALWKQALDAVADFRASAGRVGYELDHHSTIELAEFEARYRSDGIIDVDRLQECLHSDVASPEHRLHAGYWLLAVSLLVGKPELATTAWRSAEHLVMDENIDAVARHRLAMIYHTDFGDLDLAVIHARSLVRESRTHEDPVTFTRALRNASLSLRRAGVSEESLTMLEESYQLAVRYHSRARAGEAAHLIAALSLQKGDTRSTQEWLSIAEGWYNKSESLFDAHDLLATKARFAALSGQMEKATELIAELHDWRDDPHVRRRQETVSLVLFVAAVDFRVESQRDLLAEAEKVYDALKARGHQDFAVVALAQAYCSLSERGRAQELVGSYLRRYRRDRGLVLPALALLSQTFEVSPADYAETRAGPLAS